MKITKKQLKNLIEAAVKKQLNENPVLPEFKINKLESLTVVTLEFTTTDKYLIQQLLGVAKRLGGEQHDTTGENYYDGNEGYYKISFLDPTSAKKFMDVVRSQA